MGLWGWPWGRRGPSGFGGGSTAEEVTAGVDVGHLTAIVTGLLTSHGARLLLPLISFKQCCVFCFPLLFAVVRRAVVDRKY
jgi:hypothetical protein